MAKKQYKINVQMIYTVTNGCDTADGVRYEIGDTYNPENHSTAITTALYDMGCLSIQPEIASAENISEDE